MLKGNRMLVENHLSKEEHKVLQEGLWEKVKYGLSKLGRYKAGGKIFGKGKIDQEAGAKIQSILDKKGNELIKVLNTKIKEENPEFPNNEKGEQFLKTVMEIAAVYDSIIEATKKNPKEEGYLPTDAANVVIEDLAEYVKKFLDVDLSASYSVMDSEEEKVTDDGEEELLTDEVEDINEDEAADVRAKLQAKKGDAKDRDSERMKGLKSNKLPLVLTAVGGSLGALGWLAQTDWLKSLLETWLNKPGTEGSEAIYKTVTGGKPDAQGFIHWAHQIDPNNPMKTGADVSNFVNKFGAENVSHMFDGNGAGDSMDQVGKLQQLVGGENAGKSVGDLFKGSTFGDMKGGRNLFGVSKAASFVSKIIIKQATKAVAGSAAGTVLATKIAAVGSVLAPLGIGLLATGALVKLMRVKGQKQSRAKTLQDLLNSLQPVKAEEASLPPVLDIEANKPKEEKTTTGGDSKNNKDGLFNDLAGFFKFTYNNRKMASPEIFGDKKEDLNENPCSKFTKGQKVKTKAGKTVEVIANSIEDDSIQKGQVKVKREDGGTYAVGCTQLSESMIKNNKLINEMSNNNLISEGKFIKDPEVIKILKQKSGIDQNKLKFFEGFLTRIEIIRNKVKKMNNTGDKVIDKYIQKLKANPIMKTDFTNTFNVNPKKPESVEKMGKFINSFIEVIYKGNFRGKTFKDAGGMVNKMGILGGGNINKPMGESYIVEEDNVERKPGLKQNTIQFIVDVMGLFQYMYKLKKEGKLGGKSDTKTVEKKAPGSSKEKKPTEKPEVKQESIQKPENKFLKEEVKRILTLMNKI
jgi:hypothetical protein